MTSLALALVLLSALLHAVWSVAIKASDDPLLFNLLQLAAPSLALVALLPWVGPEDIPPAAWPIVACSGVVHGLYFLWMSRAFEEGDLSLVYPIARSTPAFLPPLAVLLLGETLSPGGVVGIGIVVAGIWLVHAGPRLRLRDFAARSARFAYLTLAATVAYSLLDKVAMSHLAQAHWRSPVPRAVVYSLMLSTACAIVFVPLALRRRSLPRLRAAARAQLGRATAATVVSFASYTLILQAFTRAEASYVVAVRQTSVLFAVALGAFWLGERPGLVRALGAVATVVGVGMIAAFS